ncbi:phasin family protein [Undibacterium parvum]|uniref:Phasin family protein n=1 Tax=Undibacterium parvum TaxID=401471 RepID=A0A3S9HMQ1_9BURK|nr:phasin family protein [Undibacterium parvum]AZP13355.1 phasin family protein [Undibacterium parvum]
MSTIPEQVSAAAQTQLATQLAVINTLSHTAFGGIQKLIALNFSLIQQSMESSVATTQKLMAAKDPQEVLAVSSAQAQPRIEKILAYGRELASISNAARSDFLQAVGSVSADQPAATVKVSSAPVASKTKADSIAAPAVAATTKPAKAPKAPAKLAVKAEVKVAVKPATKPATKPVVSAKKPGAKPALSSNTQLPLLTESVAKPAAAKPAVAKTAAAKTAVAKAKPATAPAPVAAAPAIKASTPKAKPAASKPAAPIQAATTASAPAAVKVEVKPALKTEVKAEVKPTLKAEVKAEPAAQPELAKTASVATVVPTRAVTTTAAAEPVVSKPAITGLPTKAAAKPGFPAVGGRPAFKEKSSKATGAKMRVRQ